MRALVVAAAVASAASLLGFAQSTASATAPAAVLIEIHPAVFCCPEIGSWEASGAITDSGSFFRSFAESAPPDRPPFSLGPFREIFVLTSAADPQTTLTVREEARLTAAGQTGVWEVASGTGVYADASGHGTVAFSVEPGPPLVFTLSLAGVISKAG